jgi:hypothetical protein
MNDKLGVFGGKKKVRKGIIKAVSNSSHAVVLHVRTRPGLMVLI